MAELKEEEQLRLLRELLKRGGAGLDKQVGELFGRYESQSTRSEQYRQLLREFGLEDEAHKERQGSQRFKMVTMLYIVVNGFEELTQREDVQRQLDLLDELNFNISDIAQQHNLLKLPTIGDNILLVGGATEENKTNPIDATLAAEALDRWTADFRARTGCIWQLAIGMHTGPATARYAARKRVPYTLTGSNVLTATRLGRAVQNGRVSLSPMTYELIREFYGADKAGRIPVKYSGVMDTYVLGALRPEMADPEHPGQTNDLFELTYRRLQFMDIQERMLDMLEEQLPKTLYYHNVKHTIDVTTEVELIGWAEGLQEKDILLLKVAALFHDSGHIKTYAGHEEVSCQYAAEILPRYHYPAESIATIQRIIMATKLPHQPADILEAVIQDSDLDYLGRSDFIPVSNNLYKEMTERGSKVSIDEWNKIQIKFISSHQYYTETAQSLREVNKQNQIERLKELVEASEQGAGQTSGQDTGQSSGPGAPQS